MYTKTFKNSQFFCKTQVSVVALFIWDRVSFDSCPFGIVQFWIVSILDCVHSRWCPFKMVYIRDGVHSRWCPFEMMSNRDRVQSGSCQSGSCPFWIVFIWDQAFQEVFRDMSFLKIPSCMGSSQAFCDCFSLFLFDRACS